MARPRNRMKARAASTASRVARATPKPPPQPPPRARALAEEPRVRSVEEMFAGPRPASFSRGLEPAFLLIDREVMEQLRARASALGLGGYDSLVKRILREHVHEY